MDWKKVTKIEKPRTQIVTKGSAIGPYSAGFDELTVKYHKPENSEFWDFCPNGKITTIFCFVLFVKCLLNYIFILFYVC